MKFWFRGAGYGFRVYCFIGYKITGGGARRGAVNSPQKLDGHSANHSLRSLLSVFTVYTMPVNALIIYLNISQAT